MGSDILYYVYQHRRKDTNEIFYIGKGRGYRAWNRNSRNSYWNHIVSKHGYTVEILKDFEDESEAYSLEVELIKNVNPVANFTSGGEGGSSWWDSASEDVREQFRQDSKERCGPGVEAAAKLRKGQTKETHKGLARMAEKHSISNSGEGNPMFGKSHWHNKTETEANTIKKKTSETLKQTYKDNPRKYKIVKCPHCGLDGAVTGMTRYHFDNCKKRVTI